jgi:hypothetical protein
MLVYSHIWDALLKLISIFAIIALVVRFKLDEHIHPVALMIAIVVAIWVLLYRQYVSILSSWLYARLALRTDITFSEAKALRKLFQLDLSGKWIPLKSVKQLPSDQRRAALLHALSTCASRRAMLF